MCTTIDRDLARPISGGQTDPDVMLKHAITKGFSTMADDARKKVLDGITTVEEAYRVLGLG